MKTTIAAHLIAGAIFAAGLVGTSLPASAQVAHRIAAQIDANGVAAEYAQYRGRGFRGHGGVRRGFRGHGRGHGYRGRGYGRGYYGGGYRRRGIGSGALIGGLAAGALIGGAIASQAPAPNYGGNATAYCQQRFKSFDPASGTYLGYDGKRHPCP